MNEEPISMTDHAAPCYVYELRIAQVRRSLMEWLRLASGDEIALEPMPADPSIEGIPVEIFQSGRRVALGELVRTNDLLAIRVLQLFDASPTNRDSLETRNPTTDNATNEMSQPDVTKRVVAEGGVS